MTGSEDEGAGNFPILNKIQPRMLLPPGDKYPSIVWWLCIRKCLKYGIQICKFWCILTAIMNVVLAAVCIWWWYPEISHQFYHGDHFSGKPQYVSEFCNCQGIVMKNPVRENCSFWRTKHAFTSVNWQNTVLEMDGTQVDIRLVAGSVFLSSRFIWRCCLYVYG